MKKKGAVHMIKNSNDINSALKKYKRGGKLCLPAFEYEINESVILDMPCMKIEGEVWNYPSDPNGVFESEYGTKLRLKRNDIPAIYISRDNVLGGIVVSNIGIQGNISGMDTRGLFDYSDPRASSGICFDSKRVDQCEFSKVSFTGLGSAICAVPASEIDGCTFEKINTDGCCIGVYFAPRASYYPMFRNCIVADTPEYGFLANGENTFMHNLDIDGARFVRNGGGFRESVPFPKAAVCFYKVSKCAVRNCIFDAPGEFWYYEPDAVKNSERQPQKNAVPALVIEGNGNRITGNTFLNCSAEAIIVNGDNNVIMNNICDGDIVINGNNNTVINNAFTKNDTGVIYK